MFWLFSFRQGPAQAAHSWLSALRTPSGAAVAALATFAKN